MTGTPEFSRPLPTDRIGAAGLTHSIAATDAECAALALRFGIPAVRSLAATFRLTRGVQGRITAEAELAGRVVRDCVVSLEPFETGIAERFAVAFVPADRLDPALDLEGVDEIPYEGNLIDLGEAAAEQVALTLDPYPRRPDATLPEGGEAVAASPFAVLAQPRAKPD